jgi:hypothetical protein
VVGERYKKLYVKVYGDDKFVTLSAPAPNGQTLWLYLLTGPPTTTLPGLLHVGEAALAEQIGWPMRAFRRCFAELEEREMVVADWPNRVVWIPKVIDYDRPNSPNVVKGWSQHWDRIPSASPLKALAHARLRDFLTRYESGRFLNAFLAGCQLPGAEAGLPVSGAGPSTSCTRSAGTREERNYVGHSR